MDAMKTIYAFAHDCETICNTVKETLLHTTSELQLIEEKVGALFKKIVESTQDCYQILKKWTDRIKSGFIETLILFKVKFIIFDSVLFEKKSNISCYATNFASDPSFISMS